MNGEEAITTLKNYIERITGGMFPGEREILVEAFDALRENQQRQPDPITGLVPCGCGGKAIMLCDLEYAVACEKCLIGLPYAFDTEELARQAWNTAMCYTAPPLSEKEEQEPWPGDDLDCPNCGGMLELVEGGMLACHLCGFADNDTAEVEE